jgi:hypothetical protein
MCEGVGQFASHWRVQLHDPRADRAISCSYRVRQLPEPIG